MNWPFSCSYCPTVERGSCSFRLDLSRSCSNLFKKPQNIIFYWLHPTWNFPKYIHNLKVRWMYQRIRKSCPFAPFSCHHHGFTGRSVALMPSFENLGLHPWAFPLFTDCCHAEHRRILLSIYSTVPAKLRCVVEPSDIKNRRGVGNTIRGQLLPNSA